MRSSSGRFGFGQITKLASSSISYILTLGKNPTEMFAFPDTRSLARVR
jgi:hypothetical protein